MHPNAKDLTGKRFGRLVVLRRAGTASGREILWECLCDCGARKDIRSSHLSCGRTASCGCLAKEIAGRRLRGNTPANRMEPGVAAFRALVKQYRNHARKRGREWALSSEACRRLFQSPCFYCGVDPEKIVQPAEDYYGVYRYNGLDRLDNSRGYTPANVVPCCRPCNMAKGTRSAEDFLAWAQRLCAYLCSR